MIIEYDADGRPFHVIGTYAKTMAAILTAQGKTFLELSTPPMFSPLTDGYVVDGALRQRPSLDVGLSKNAIRADGVDAAVLTGLPVPCSVFIDDIAYPVDDGELVITSPMAATYALRIDQWPYFPWSGAITAE